MTDMGSMSRTANRAPESPLTSGAVVRRITYLGDTFRRDKFLVALARPNRSASRILQLDNTRQETRVTESLRDGGKSRCRPAPTDLVDIAKERSIGAQRSERLEQKRHLFVVAEH